MEEKSYKAISKYLMVSPTKVRPVADLVRGKSVPQAAAILEAMPQKGARLILKVLNSATANALYANKKWGDEELTVSQLLIDDGPTLKRVWARSHGKRDILIKRMSHITVVVSKALEA